MADDYCPRWSKPFSSHIQRPNSILALFTSQLHSIIGSSLCPKHIIGSKRDRKGGNFFPHFSPILFVILIYESLGSLIQYLHPDIDSWLIKIDFFIFGVHPTSGLRNGSFPWLTDVMSLAYLSYYFLPVILIVVIYLQHRTWEFDESVFILLFGYYLSFIGYILFPAIGPRHALAHLYSVPLEGSFITDFVRDGLNTLEHNKRDCMPSGHTQIVLIVLYLANRFEKRIFYLFLPIVCCLILSTVYLRYHYVIDLFVGDSVCHRMYDRWPQTLQILEC